MINKNTSYQNGLLKQNINDAYNLKSELENLLKKLDNLIHVEEKYLKKHLKKELNKELKTYKCSKCESLISDEQSYYFHRVKYIDGYCVQRLNVEEKLNQVKRIIELDSQHYESIIKKI